MTYVLTFIQPEEKLDSICDSYSDGQIDDLMAMPQSLFWCASNVAIFH